MRAKVLVNIDAGVIERQEKMKATAGGFGAILFWSTTVAIARSLSEQLGPITAGAAVYGICAAAAMAHRLYRHKIRPYLWGDRPAPVRYAYPYLIGCGITFVLYTLVLYMSIGLAGSRTQALEVGLCNYLWPALTLLFSPLIAGHKAGFGLLPGTALAMTGVVLVLTHESGFSWASLVGNLAANPLPYGLGLTAAVSWALYSNLARRWGGGQGPGAVWLFVLITAVILSAASLFSAEPKAFTQRAMVEASFLGLATYAGYALWDTAMRRGHMVLVAAGSYSTPLLSTVISLIYLDVTPGRSLWIGCLLLITGSVISWRSVRERAG